MKCVRKCCELLKSAEEEASRHLSQEWTSSEHKSKLKTVFLIFIPNFRWNFPDRDFLLNIFPRNFSLRRRMDGDRTESSSEDPNRNRSQASARRQVRVRRVIKSRVIGPIRPTFQFAAPRTKLLAFTRIQVSSCERARLQFLMRKLFNDKETKFVIMTFRTDDVIPYPGIDIADGRGTYVIRKGRRRQRIDDYGDLAASMSSVNSKLSKEALCESTSSALNVPSPVYPPSMMIPNSRHSIDLGASPRHQAIPYPFHQPSVVNSPRLEARPPGSQSTFHSFLSSTPNRSRLSLDLSSPVITNSVIDHQKMAHTPTNSSTPTTKSPSVTKLNTPTSPLVANSGPFPSRYTEFKTYSSTFDGLQALETHNGPAGTVNVITRVAPQANVSPDNPLMRVSSLPAIVPQNQLAGNYECITS